jgi:hypothetical protein
MNRDTVESVARLTVVLTEAVIASGEKPSVVQIQNDTLDLHRLANRLLRRLIRECNHNYETQREADLAYDAKQKDLAHVQSIVTRYGGSLIKGEGVQGFVFRIELPTGRTNSMTNVGWGIRGEEK